MQPSETGRERPNAAGFAWQGDDVFGRIAHRYDRLCDLFSLGIHRHAGDRLARHRALSNCGNWTWSTFLYGPASNATDSAAPPR